jgi:hypothetical protein
VLVINESTGFFLRSSQDPDVSLVDRIRQHSGAPDAWRVFGNAVTNSNCTDVSIPSILTGSGTHEGIDKLHAMPFVFDIAKARGYRTAFFTSAVVAWANLATFLSSARIDHMLTASEAGHPFINDLATDDMAIMKDLRRFILEVRPSENLFLVVYPNAMHTPYQHTGDIEFPAGMDDNVLRALFILESEHKLLFDTLRETGRFDDALIIETGDHGSDPFNLAFGKMSRVENYEEPILRPMFLVKPPARLPAAAAAALDGNTRALVANLDIAPTIADLLGARLTGGLRYAGFSLLDVIPPDRLAVATSTNQWRKWPNTAVALARGPDRFTCDARHMCRLDRIAPLAASSQRTPESPERFVGYLREALALPVVGPNISRLYHDRLRTAFSGGALVVGGDALRSTLSDRLGGVAGAPIIRAPAGHSPGYVLFGPYWPLATGHYEGEVMLEMGAGGAPGDMLCNVDVFDGEAVLSHQSITADTGPGARRIVVPFDVPPEAGADSSVYRRYELRLWCAGKTDVTVNRVAFLR